MSDVIAQQALAQAAALPPLLLEALRVAQTVRMGQHGQRRVGGSESFWQYRLYEGGDPAAMVDWTQSARGDLLFIRQRELEAVQTTYLWADRSGSMHYRSTPELPMKTERAHVLMLALAQLLLRGGERTSWLLPRPVTGQSLAGFHNLAAHVLPIPKLEENLPPDVPLARYAHMVLCSDFLAAPEVWERRLRGYAAENIRGILLHLADPEEEFPSFQGRVRVEGCENESPVLLPQAQAVRADYRKRVEDHQALLKEMARSAGWTYLHHITNQPAPAALLQLHNFLTAPRRGF